MADKSVGELTAAQSVTPTDLFVLEQNGTAKKLTGQILENWLVSFADGHGGINKIEKLRSSGLVDTYRITLADTTTFDFTVNNGKSITGISKTGTQGLVDIYTITYNDDQSTTFKVTNGAKGDKGDNAYTWIKYASQKPTESSHSMGDVPDNWIGVYTGNKSSAPSDWKEYKWFQWKGNTGNTGAPAKLVSQEVKYQVGDSGSIFPSGNWQSNVPVTPQGKYLWVRTTLTFNSGSPVVSYAVSRQGLDGSGSVSSVAGISPDPQGNVPLSAADVGALATTGGEMTGPIEMNGQPISGLNPPKTETEPVTKGDGDARYLQKAGGVPVPEMDDQAVNRGYVKNAVDTLGISGASRANSVVVERDLGTVFTPEQSEDIRSGKFDIVRTGCYWTINGRKYWAAHADYRLHCGDTALSTHHMLFFPDKSLFNMAWNKTDDTTGGYVNSKVKTEGMAHALEIIKGDFGADHILPYRTILTNAVTNGMSSGWAWYDRQVDLMNEKMVYGSHAWGGGSQNGYDTSADKSQIALFKARHDLITNRENWWLRDMRSATYACGVANDGYASSWGASLVLGVRPAFLIY